MGRKLRIATILSALLLAAAPASAVSTLDATLDLRLCNGASGEFATVTVSETGDGGLEFTIRLLDSLGPRADLNALFFNLPSDVSELEVETLGSATHPFDLRRGGRPRGANGSRFDFAVRFGNGRGLRGNGTLQEASFVIYGDRELSLSDLLLEPSETRRGVETHFAANVAGAHANGPSVGGFAPNPVVVPEPGTALLLGGALVSLGALRRGRRVADAGAGERTA